SGTYDPALPGRIRWGAAPELALSGVSAAGLSGRNAYLRVSSFAECNSRLYAAVGQQIYERVDSADPHWRVLYTNPRSGPLRDGVARVDGGPGPRRPRRGLTCRRRRQRGTDRAH